ncbi:MAG: DUF1844 domain-containing protein [Candidatus Aminicenantes bacterium]|nr:DUF1844 domain-containing protein [Candidatus Aminicenantes bacterium]
MAEKKKENKKDPQEIPLPPLDFSSIVLPFFIQATMSLGLVENPNGKKKEIDLNTAQRLIDLLDLLKQKTQGNLNPDEEKFLTGCLHQLKTRFTELANSSKK